jgi:hypothetical protein
VCGTWSRVPHSYRRQLRRDELWAQLTNANGDSVTGRVAKHFGLTSELFSGLLLAEKGERKLNANPDFPVLLCLIQSPVLS